MKDLMLQKHAVISPDGVYRYRLSRIWDSSKLPLVWIMLNPSTADAIEDDPTIRRCISFARRESCGGIEVLNLFAYRATNPKELMRVTDPVGPDNDKWIQEVLHSQVRCVCGWGAFPKVWDRAAAVLDLARGINFLCLGRTAAGHPLHPLYIANDQPFIPWAI
jgi:hypothetical protein